MSDEMSEPFRLKQDSSCTDTNGHASVIQRNPCLVEVQAPVFVAPSTLPMMLYRLLKNVNQSFNTFLCSSDRSDHSGRHSAQVNKNAQ